MKDKKSKWIIELSSNFVPLPKDKEDAYWAAIRFFAKVMFSDMIDAKKEVDEKKCLHPLERDEDILQEAA